MFDTKFNLQSENAIIEIFFSKIDGVFCVTLCESFDTHSNSKCVNFNNIDEALSFYNGIIKDFVTAEENIEKIYSRFNI